MSKEKVSKLINVAQLMEKCGATLRVGDGAIYFLAENRKLTVSDIGWLKSNGAVVTAFNGEPLEGTHGLARVVFN